MWFIWRCGGIYYNLVLVCVCVRVRVCVYVCVFEVQRPESLSGFEDT